MRAFDVLEELFGDIGESRFADQEGIGDAVHPDRAFVTLAVRLQIDVEVAPGQAPADDLDAADLDDPVAFGDRHAGGFGIEDDVPVDLLLHAGGSNLHQDKAGIVPQTTGWGATSGEPATT